MRTQAEQKPKKPRRSLNPLTQRVWVLALGRYGSPASANPWNAYRGDYSDASLARFSLSVRSAWLDDEDAYLTSHALAVLAKGCADKGIQNRWERIEALLPTDSHLPDEELPEE